MLNNTEPPMFSHNLGADLINGWKYFINFFNKLWFTFSIDPQNSDSARGDTLHTAKLSFEDRSGTSSDQDYNDGDLEGDACDTDDDNDGCLDSEDDNPLVFSEDSDSVSYTNLTLPTSDLE